MEWLSTIRPGDVLQGVIVLGGGLIFLLTMRNTIERVSERLAEVEKTIEKFNVRIEDFIQNAAEIKFLRRDIDALYAERRTHSGRPPETGRSR